MILDCAAQLQMITFHQAVVDVGSQCRVCRDNSVNILHVKSTVLRSLTLLLKFEDHLLRFLLLGAVSAPDLLDLVVLSVQDLRTDSHISVCFTLVLQIIDF